MKQLGEAVDDVLAASSRVSMATIRSTDTEPCPICGGLGYVREDVPVKGLPFGKHKAVLKPVLCPGAKGANFELCAVGVIR